MKRHFLEFSGPGRVVFRTEESPRLLTGEVLVRTRFSAVSQGTEMLVYRGQWPQGVSVDATVQALAGEFSYPLVYGYCAVGRVIETGREVSGDWLGRRVFSFQPHQDLFCSRPQTLFPIPDDLDDETALFLPAMETAVNLVLDGGPLLGEKVVVVGQGIVGLLTTALLARFPLAKLVTLDSYPLRREASKRLGAGECYDPKDPALHEKLGVVAGRGGDADLVYELSGNPEGLNAAVSFTRFSGRVVVGSWYGTKKVDLDLGSCFHRGRVSLVSSQVSSIAPELSGRWQTRRRLDLAWEMLRLVHPSACITQRFALNKAPEAYALIDRFPEQTVQIIFDHQLEDKKATRKGI